MGKTLYVSVSQLESFDNLEGDGCPRAWWAKKIMKLPEPTTKAQGFGTAFHAVNERYLLADDLGRNQDGSIAELYPDGWDSITERSGQVTILTPEEKDKVKVLHSKLQEQGYIARWSDREVEYEFGMGWKGGQTVPILEHNGTKVCFIGVIDVLLPGEVLDWKTTGNMRYAKSANKLRKSLQMLGYAKVLLLRAAASGGAVPDQVRLTHVVACKKPTAAGELKVRRTSVDIGAEEIESGWARIKELARRMVEVLVFQSEEDWFAVPGPREGSYACNMYGGCPRQLVCAGQHSVQKHRSVMDNLVATSVESSVVPMIPVLTPVLHTQKPMSLLADRAAAAAAAPAPLQPLQAAQPASPLFGGTPVAAAPVFIQPNPVVAPVAAMAPPPMAVAPVTLQMFEGPPPWAFAGCTACGGSDHPGWNTAGSACRICEGASAARGFTSAMYSSALQGSERFWSAREEHKATLVSLGLPLEGKSIAAPAPQVVAQDRPAPIVAQMPMAAPVAPIAMAAPLVAPTPLAAPVAQAQPVMAETTLVAPTVDPAVVSPKAGRGRPTGFTLFINCISSVGKTPESLEQLFLRLSQELASASGVASYYELPVWPRRDSLASQAQAVAEALGKKKVSISVVNPDVAHFVAALRPYANEVIEPIGIPIPSSVEQ